MEFGAGYNDSNLVFTQPNGNPLHGYDLTQRDFRNMIDTHNDEAEEGTCLPCPASASTICAMWRLV